MTITLLEGPTADAVVCSGAAPFRVADDESVCRYAVAHDGAFLVPDLQQDRRTRHLSLVDGRRGHLRSYASVPVHAPDGSMLARLEAWDSRPRVLTPEQLRMLEVLGGSVSTTVALRCGPGYAAGAVAAPSEPAPAVPVPALVSQTASLLEELQAPLIT